MSNMSVMALNEKYGIAVASATAATAATAAVLVAAPGAGKKIIVLGFIYSQTNSGYLQLGVGTGAYFNGNIWSLPTGVFGLGADFMGALDSPGVNATLTYSTGSSASHTIKVLYTVNSL